MNPLLKYRYTVHYLKEISELLDICKDVFQKNRFYLTILFNTVSPQAPFPPPQQKTLLLSNPY